MQITTETRVGIFILLAIGVFGFMTFQLGVFRFDRAKYNSYTVHFKDVAGLSKKADVKIAGVKVGWVDKLTLRDSAEVEAKVAVLKNYHLYVDAYAIVRQDGLLGSKYLEVIPGDPLLAQLPSGSELSRPSREPVSVDDILHNVKRIAHNIEDVTSSLKEALGGQQGAQRIEQTVEHIGIAAEKLASFADSINHFMAQNEDHLTGVMQDIRAVASELRSSVPRMSDQLQDIFSQVSSDVLPQLHDSAHKISEAIDRDFNRIACKIELAAESIDQTSNQVRCVAKKLNDGDGLIGKLINEDETYRDLKSSLSSVRNYFNKLESVVIVVDAYSERFNRDAPGLNFKNSKGYFYFRVYPNEEHYWLLGVTTNNEGIVDRDVYLRQWFDNGGCEIIPEDIIPVNDRDRLRFAPEVKFERRRLDAVTYNAQFVKLFEHLAFRIGLFESTAGVAIDYDIPIPFVPDHLRWVTTLEAFDFNGRHRIDDERLHLKWLNRVFFIRNFYMTFGAEDFVSKFNKNAFFGVGIRFEDEDLKYLLSRILITV